MNKFSFWLDNARKIALPQSLLPCITAIVLSIGEDGFFWPFILPVVLGVAAGHLGMNLADDYFDGDEIQAMLQEAITSLPEKQRAIFNMRYFDEMKYTDMSEILGTSVGALKASYHIAVKKISEYFKQRD